MAKYLSKRNRPDAVDGKLTPKMLLRQNQTPATKVPRNQCTGLAKSRLKRHWLAVMREGGHVVPADDDPNYRYSEITELARTLGYDTDPKKLSPETRAKCRCVRVAIAGGFVCRSHGGSRQSVINNARERIYELIDPSLTRLSKVITKGKHEPAVVSAIKDVLDRVGLKKPEDMLPGQGWSEEMIAKMADVFDEDELENFIKLYRKLQAAMPEDSDEEGTMGVGVGSTPKLGPLKGAKVIEVAPKQMAELIKGSRK